MLRIVLCVCAVALLGCPRPIGSTTGGTRVEVKPNAAADAALAQARALKADGPRKVAIEALLAVRKTYPESTAGQDALWEAGVLAYEEGDYVTARKALNELVFENPLHPMAKKARLTSGLAAAQQKAWRDAYQTLSPLLEDLEGEDRRLAQEALQKAAAGSNQHAQALRMAVRALQDAAPEARAQAMTELEDVVESKTTFLAIAEVWNELSSSHPAWPLLTFKMSRVYYHLRDWNRLTETLQALLDKAPASPYAPEAKTLLARVARRTTVRPKAIGVVLPMTGRYKALGDTVLRALQLAVKGSDLELVVKDTKGDVTITGQMVEQLAFDDGVVAIIGPLLSDDSRRAALVAEELQVPLITMSRGEGVTEIGPHIFRTMVTNSQQAEALADYAVGQLGYKHFAVLYPNIPFGVELTNSFWDAIEQRGGDIRAAESYDHDQTTFTEEAKKLVGRYYLEDRHDYLEKRRAVLDSDIDDFRKRKAMEKVKGSLEPLVDFDALLVPDSWQRVGLVAPALAVEDIITNACDKKDIERIQKTTGKGKLKTVTLLGPSTWASPKGPTGDPGLIERGGKFVLCSIYVDGFFEFSERPQTKAFVDAFRGAHRDASLTLLDAVAYDTAALVKKVIDTQQPTSRNAFRAALSSTKGFEGATGTISFDDKREARRKLFLLSVTSKGIKELAPDQKPEG